MGEDGQRLDDWFSKKSIEAYQVSNRSESMFPSRKSSKSTSYCLSWLGSKSFVETYTDERVVGEEMMQSFPHSLKQQTTTGDAYRYR